MDQTKRLVVSPLDTGGTVGEFPRSLAQGSRKALDAFFVDLDGGNRSDACARV